MTELIEMLGCTILLSAFSLWVGHCLFTGSCKITKDLIKVFTFSVLLFTLFYAIVFLVGTLFG